MILRFVYLLKTSIGAWKIGASKSPKERIMDFKNLPFLIELEHEIESADARKIERALHYHFRGKRIRGEWFGLSDDDVLLIKTIRRCDDISNLPPPIESDWNARSKSRDGFLLRVPEDLWAQFAAAAAREDRSATQQLVRLIRQFVAKPKRKKSGRKPRADNA